MKTQNWFLKQADLNPTRLAVTDGREALTFAQLATRVQDLAGHLAAVSHGPRVGLLTKNKLLGYQLALAIMGLGKTIVWLNWRLASEELAWQVEDSALDLVLVDDDLWRADFDDRYRSFSQLLAQPAAPRKLVAEFDHEAVASIMYTSGTTGRPKGVLQIFGNHYASAIASSLNLGLVAGEEWLCVTPLFHISGFSIVMRGLVYGMPVRLMDHFDAAAVTQVLAEEPVTIISAVPYMLKQLLKVRQAGGPAFNPHFRLVLLGGGTIDRASLTASQAAGFQVVQCYGMTETCSQVIALSAADAAAQLGAVGKPLFTTRLKLLEESGEVAIKTPALSPGYLNQPEKMAAKMRDGWYLTGDIGHLNDAGFLFIDGRKDEMIISGGENIFPQEVEQAFLQAPGVAAIAVVGVPDDTWGVRPVAFVVGARQSEQALIDYGYAHLAHYKVPRHFFFVDQLPTNAAGKLQRFKLRELAAAKLSQI